MNRSTRWLSGAARGDGGSATSSTREAEGRELAANAAILARRARVLIALFMLILAGMVARLAYWQLLGPETTEASPAAGSIEPGRGRILDRNGLLLAVDNYVGDVYASPQSFRSSSRRDTLAISVTQTLREPIEVVRAALEQDSKLVVLAKATSAAQCEQINKLAQRDSVWCDPRYVRTYPQGALAAYLIGFSNSAREGVYGVEASYDEWLRSDGDWLPSSFPTAGEPLPESWRLYLPSPVGRDLVLNMDAPLQYVVERRLREAVVYYGAESGTIIMMDPRTGAVLALASYPSFDPNHFSDVDDQLWVNSAISEIYEPGSVFKLVTMSAGLDSGQINPNSYFLDDGTLKVGTQTIHNAEGHFYGNVTVTEALAKSLNVVAAKVSLQLGAQTFYRYVTAFGFGTVTETDLRLEAPGIVKEPGNPLWSPFDQATNSFGQGISVTSLQMVNAVAAIANDGVLLQPQIAKGLVKDGLLHSLPARVLGRPIRAESARLLTGMMVYTIESSSTRTPVPGYRVAGKTGTAQIPTAGGYSTQDVITSIAGFLPAADPKLVVFVKLVKPQRASWAEQVVMPVFSQVTQEAVQILGIKPDDRMP